MLPCAVHTRTHARTHADAAHRSNTEPPTHTRANPFTHNTRNDQNAKNAPQEIMGMGMVLSVVVVVVAVVVVVVVVVIVVVVVVPLKMVATRTA